MDDILVYLRVFIVFNIAFTFCNADKDAYLATSDINGIKMECKGSEVIQILETEIASFESFCGINKCNLTEDDVEEIRSCTGLTSCRISLNHLSTCLMDTGFFHVRYSCERYALVTCDFEKSECGWVDQQSKWKRLQARKFGQPKRDHTTGSFDGYYIAVELDRIEAWRLTNTEIIHRSHVQCLTFSYFMTTSSSGKLNVYQTNGDGVNRTWTFYKTNQFLWNNGSIRLDNNLGDFFITFEAYKKRSWEDLIVAIDDIEIINSKCEQDYLLSCDFEDSMCEWNGGAWEHHQDSYFVDHTFTSKNGHVAFMDATYLTNYEATNLTSPVIDDYGLFCFKFWYSLYGEQKELPVLKVYIQYVNSMSELMWTGRNDKSNIWYLGYIEILVAQPVFIIFEGVKGDAWRSDIAIDDIHMFQGSCSGISTYQRSCTEIENDVTLDECSANYVINENIAYQLDPRRKCFYDDENTTSEFVCLISDESVVCHVNKTTVDFPECFHTNQLEISYNCSAPFTYVAKETGLDTTNTGTIIGVIVGVLLIVGLASTVILILYRHRRPLPKLQTPMCTYDYTENQDIAMHSTNSIATQSKYEDIQNSAHFVNHDYTSIETTNNSRNVQLDVTCLKENYASANNWNVDHEYDVLDCSATGYTGGKSNIHALASSLTQAVEDGYAESTPGHYDISGQNRHCTENAIYDHSVDETYDLANSEQKRYSGNYTYNHMFGRQTKENYNSTGRKSVMKVSGICERKNIISSNE